MQAMLSSPLSTINEVVTSNANHIYGEAFSYDILKNENAALKQTIATLEEAEKENRLLTYENNQLRSLLDFSKEASIHTTPCKIISYGTNNWARTYLLSKGSKDGLHIGQSIIDENGRLLGFISEVGTHTSTMQSLLDPSTNVVISFSSTQDIAVLSSSLDDMTTGLLTITNIPRDSQISIHDYVITLPSSEYPDGLSIGTIASIKLDSSGLYQTAKVKPYVTTHTQRQVFVITNFT